ncbi:MAG: hypothetical protein ACLQU1_15515 [Bryobacteraceae bacterium]
MKHLVWVSFDLGIRGDYEGLYAWLDSHKAIECGDSLACLWYEHPGDLVQDMTRDLNASVNLDAKRSRIYVVRLVEDKMKGSFIFGRRRTAPWAGFAATGEQVEDTNVELREDSPH